ncbi:MAG TPA: outer membrane lipoprotein carrier protein LolA [Burkholderiales bacterium]|nr:outer membrane lipoprotein carrier protein LolA [Burkholderiales bacterium]
MTTGHSRPARGLVMMQCAIALSLACCLRADGAEPAADSTWGVEQLMQRLAQVKNVQAKFVERKHLRILNAPLEFSGTLTYKAPGHLEKHTLLPKPQSLILDQDRLSIEDPTRKQRRTLKLQDYPVVWAFVESIRSTLAGDLQALNRFYKVDLEGSEIQWRLLLKPSEPAMQSLVTQIRISGARQSIRTIEIVEAEGDRSIMTITENAESPR